MTRFRERPHLPTLVVLSFLIFLAFSLPASSSIFSFQSSLEAQAIDSAVNYTRDLYYDPDGVDLKKMLHEGLREGVLAAGGDTETVNIDAEIPEDPEWNDLRASSLEQRLRTLLSRTEIEDPSAEAVLYDAAEGMFSALEDPYTRLIREDEYEDLKTETSQEFGGLGIFISFEEEELTVVAPIEGTPAFEAGLMPRDRITEIDGEPASELENIQDAVDRLRGEKGSQVELTIQRGEGEFQVELTRDEIPIQTVYSEMVDSERGIGVIRITNFGEQTAQEVRDELESLREQGLEALLLDLRGNPGGLLSAASQVADLWIDEGNIVRTQGRTSRQNQGFPASSSSVDNDYEMMVLVDGGSASGSEIVAGALQAHDRATIVGEQTFGKGLVQSVFPLDDGSALSLTTARYFTPDNRVIHGEGIEPQIKVERQEPDEETQEELRQLTEENTIGRWIGDREDVSGDRLPEELVRHLREEGYTLDERYIRMRYNQVLARQEGRTMVIDPQSDSQLRRSLKAFRGLMDGMSPEQISSEDEPPHLEAFYERKDGTQLGSEIATAYRSL